MRVLVTGAAGFVGSHVARRIVREGHEVWAAVLPGESTETLAEIMASLSVVPIDLRETAALKDLLGRVRPELAVHLAWYAVPGKYWTALQNLECVAMTLGLAQALAEVGCKRLVAAGTCAEYDWDYGFLSEDTTPLHPRSLYGACKDATRQILEAYCRQVSMSFAWTRFFYLYGPCEAKNRLVPSVVRALLNRQPARCTSGEQVRDFLYVADVASAVWAVAGSALCGPVNIGSGQPVRVRTLVEAISRLMGGQGKVEFGALPDDPQDPPLLLADVGKLRRQTAWTPGFDLEAGLGETIAWWRAHEDRSS